VAPGSARATSIMARSTGQRGTQFVGGAGDELALGVEQLMPGRHVADLASMLITTTSSFRST